LIYVHDLDAGRRHDIAACLIKNPFIEKMAVYSFLKTI